MFAVFFPIATGVVSPLNMVPQLERAARNFPNGVLVAILVVTLVYCVVVVFIGCSVSRDDLRALYLVLRFQSLWQPLVIVAALSDALSSAYINMQIAPRTFAWMLRDKVFLQYRPFLFFAVGHGRFDVPARGLAAVVLIASVVVAFGSINWLSKPQTMMLMLVFACVNFGCALSATTNSPAWRPQFRRYSPLVATIGGFFCVTTAFLISVETTVALLAFVSLVMWAVWRYGPSRREWGPAASQHKLSLAIQWLRSMNDDKRASKTYRPHVSARRAARGAASRWRDVHF